MKEAPILFSGPNFNSTLVRLKATSADNSIGTVPEFQFHFGTIERTVRSLYKFFYIISIPLWYD